MSAVLLRPCLRSGMSGHAHPRGHPERTRRRRATGRTAARNKVNETMTIQSNLTLRQLRAFVLTYQQRNLTHAAEAMHVTQPAMSALIRQLEDSLNVKLFERTPRFLRPTRAADEAFARVEEILARANALEVDMHDRGRDVERCLAFSASASISASLIPHVLRRFRERFPDVRVVMHDAGDFTVIQRVLSEDVEFSIGFYEQEPDHVARTTLASDFFYVVCPLDSRLAARGEVAWRHLVGEPIINLTKGSVQARINEIFSAAGTPYRPVLETTLVTTALALAQHGFGSVVLPGFLIYGNPAAAGLSVKRLHEPEVGVGLMVHCRQGHMLSDIATKFLDMAREQLGCLRAEFAT